MWTTGITIFLLYKNIMYPKLRVNLQKKKKESKSCLLKNRIWLASPIVSKNSWPIGLWPVVWVPIGLWWVITAVVGCYEASDVLVWCAMGVVGGFIARMWLVGHNVGCGCDGLFFASLLFCGFACSVLEKRETKRKREKDMMKNKKNNI